MYSNVATCMGGDIKFGSLSPAVWVSVYRNDVGNNFVNLDVVTLA